MIIPGVPNPKTGASHIGTSAHPVYGVRSAYSILPPMVVNVYVAYIVYRTLRVVVIPT